MNIYELKCHQAMAVCDLAFKAFVVQDFSDRTMSLKPNCYNFVYRCGKSFCGETMWAYWCSCDNKRSQFIDGLSWSISSTYDLLSKAYPECYHISAIKRIVQESIDGVYDLTPETEFDDHTYACAPKPILQEFSDSVDLVKVGNDGAVCVKGEGGYGVVHQGEKGILCATCQFNKRGCPHIVKLISSISDLQPDIPGFLIPLSKALSCVEAKEHRDRSLASLLSSKPIPFKFTPALSSVLKLPFSERFQIVEGICHLSEHDHGVPSCSICDHSEWDMGCSKSTILVTQQQTLASCVYFKQCGNASCDGKAHFDGQNMGLLNMTSFCITYEVLRNHLHQFLNGRTTIFTQYTVLCKSHEDAGCSVPIPYNSYLKAWYGFVHLLDIPYENGFTCRHCGNEPDVIIMDATSLAFRKNLDAWQTLQLLQTDEKQKLRFGRFTDRVLLRDSKTRHLLSTFVSTGLPAHDYDSMLSYLQTHLPCAIAIIKASTTNHHKDKTILCKSEWSALISVMSSPSPACATIHPSERVSSLLIVMENSDITKDTTSLKVLQEEIPVIFNLIRSLGYYPKEILAPLLSELSRVAFAAFSLLPVENIQTPATLTEENKVDLSYFPSLPQVRVRGVYQADKKASGHGRACRKRSSKHPSLLPGIFTIFCQHGICYGFEVMRISESPNIPFTCIFERFKKAPTTIIYDNCCNLHQYCLNREPLFFQESWFIIDRFHWPNHSGCTVGYKMDSYPQFSNINSQVVEQANAALKRIKPSLSYMTPQNFLKHLKLFLWNRNREKNLSS